MCSNAIAIHHLFTFLTHLTEILGFLHVKFDLDHYIMKVMMLSCLPLGLVYDVTHIIWNFLFLAMDAARGQDDVR